MIVEAHKIAKRFMDEFVLDHIVLTLHDGDKIALMGPNGAGKTTLVRAILGLYKLDGGEMRVFGKDPIKSRVEVLENISFIPQLPPPIKLTIEELLNYVSKSSSISQESIFLEAERMELNLKSNLTKPFFKLSGGMKQKLLIAIALSKKSRLLIFDEPTANLDPKGREQFYRLLREIDEACSTIYITHRLDEISALVNRTIYMELGKIVEDERM